MGYLNTKEPRTFILSIAITEYTFADNLPNAIRDANSIIKVLEAKYKIAKTWSLKDEDVTENSIKKTFSEIKEIITPEDALLILYNGHGIIKGRSEKAYWLFHNSNPDTETNLYKCLDFIDEINELEIKDIALLVNSCFAGNIFYQDGFRENKYDDGSNKSRILFTAGRKYETVRDSNAYNDLNSNFTKSIIEILSDNEDSYELFLLNIIVYVYSQFDKNDYGSIPRYGSFKEDAGGQFILYLKEDRQIIWAETLNRNNIEGYDNFLQKFSSGLYLDIAKDNRAILITERNQWFETLNQINSTIQAFKKDKKVSEYIANQSETISNQIKTLKETVSNHLENNTKWEKLTDITNSQRTPLDKKIAALDTFIKSNPNGEYSRRAIEMRKNIKDRINEDKLWEEAKSKRGSFSNRKNKIISYIYQNKYGRYFIEAEKKLRDISLYIDACSKIENKNLEEGRKLLNDYLRKFPEGDYKKNVTDELDKVGIQARAKDIKIRFEDAKNGNNLLNIEEIIGEIEGFTDKNEQEENKGVLEEATKILEKYHSEKQAAFEKAKNNQNVYDLKDFINTYKDDEITNELVDEIDNILYAKEEALFDDAEGEKTIAAYQDYLNEFTEEDDRFYKRAYERIEELKFYNGLKSKEEYQEYLFMYSVNGLMLNEANKHIQQIKYDDEKKLNFETVIKSELDDKTKLLKIHEDYLEKYDEDKDDKYLAIEEQTNKLDLTLKAERLFEEIQKAKINKEKLSLCLFYKRKYSEEEGIDKVNNIKLELEKLLKSEDAFEITKEEMTIEAFEDYKQKHQENHKAADDYIDYLNAKAICSKESFNAYIQKYDNNGFNIAKAKDGLNYLKALETNETLPLYQYIENSIEKEFEELAKREIDRLDEEKEVETAFKDANILNTIKGYSEYLRRHGKKNEDYANLIIDKRNKLKRNQEDSDMFKDAKESKDVSPLSTYIDEYGTKGLYFDEAVRLKRERESGITEKNIDIAEKIDKHNDTIMSLIQYLEKSTSHNTNIMQATQKNTFRIIVGIIIGFIAIMLLFLFFK